jgi:hypothetical protein
MVNKDMVNKDMVNKDMAYRGWSKYGRQDKTNTAVNQSARTVCPGKGSSGSQGVRTFKEDRK